MTDDASGSDDRSDALQRLRREPPKFRRAMVAAKEEINPHMVRVSLTGDELDSFTVEEPAASVRVLLPSRKTGELIMPEWNGNEFLLPDGSRPSIRTFTPSITTDESLTCDRKSTTSPRLQSWVKGDSGRSPETVTPAAYDEVGGDNQATEAAAGHAVKGRGEIEVARLDEASTTPESGEPGSGNLTISVVGGCQIYVVIHDGGAASEWAVAAGRGWEVALSGPGRGYEIDDTAPAYLLGGDQSAIPAITQILEAMPQEMPTRVFIEIVDPEAKVDLPAHPRAEVSWLETDPSSKPGAALVTAVTSAAISADERVWVAGEAAAVQRIRRHLFDEVGLPRSQTTVRGYWKHGREGT